MNGFGFIEYEDPLDARDVVPGTFRSDQRNRGIRRLIHHSSLPYVLSGYGSFGHPILTQVCYGPDGSEFKGERLTVQFARGPRRKEPYNGHGDRPAPPRPRRTIYRMQVSGLPPDTSWQVSIPIPVLGSFWRVCSFWPWFLGSLTSPALLWRLDWTGPCPCSVGVLA